MPHLYTDSDGNVFIRADYSDTPTLQTLPAVNYLNRLPQILKYRKRVYITGQFSRMLMRDEFGNLRAAGVKAPKKVPTMVDAALTGGSLGFFIGYQTFVVKAGGKKIAESNPGPATITLNGAGTGRSWGNLDITPDDPHVTHTRGYVSVDGEVPALAWERALPTVATVVENVLSAALGPDLLPVRTGTNGVVVLNRYARGLPPYTKYSEEYHDAFFYAGDPLHPERIYPSRLYEPEAVNTTPISVYGRTEYPWLTTTDGAAVTGIKRQGDELVVGTLRGIDVIQGYSQGDYTIRRVSNHFGVLSHFSMCRCGPLSSLFFAAPQGPTIYNAGAFKYIGGPIDTWWRDQYRLYPEVFIDCYGGEDRYWRAYKLLLPNHPDYNTLYLVTDYYEAEKGEPNWVMDRRDRIDRVLGELLIDGSTNYFDLYTGSCDGEVRKENDETDGTDDGDTYQKKMTLTTPHRFVKGQDGDDAHGRSYVELDLYSKHTDNDVTISMWGGDDDAPSAVSPAWTRVSAATSAPAGARPLVAKTSEHHVLQNLSGKGVTLRVEVTAPVGVEFRGWSVEHTVGPQTRPFKASE